MKSTWHDSLGEDINSCGGAKEESVEPHVCFPHMLCPYFSPEIQWPKGWPIVFPATLPHRSLINRKALAWLDKLGVEDLILLKRQEKCGVVLNPVTEEGYRAGGQTCSGGFWTWAVAGVRKHFANRWEREWLSSSVCLLLSAAADESALGIGPGWKAKPCTGCYQAITHVCLWDSSYFLIWETQEMTFH